MGCFLHTSHAHGARLARTEEERSHLQVELAALRADHEQTMAMLGRYRAEAEGHHQAIQAARERLRQLSASYDERVERVRQDDAARHAQQLVQVERDFARRLAAYARRAARQGEGERRGGGRA